MPKFFANAHRHLEPLAQFIMSAGLQNYVLVKVDSHLRGNDEGQGSFNLTLLGTQIFDPETVGSQLPFFSTSRHLDFSTP